MVRTLKIVYYENIDYHLKFSNRVLLESLLARRETCDEIIIVKNGLVTDTSMSNLIFYDGTRWVTSAKPLLKGTCRERMLASGMLSEMDIRPEDIKNFKGCKLINALRMPEEEKMIPAARIIF